MSVGSVFGLWPHAFTLHQARFSRARRPDSDRVIPPRGGPDQTPDGVSLGPGTGRRDAGAPLYPEAPRPSLGQPESTARNHPTLQRCAPRLSVPHALDIRCTYEPARRVYPQPSTLAACPTLGLSLRLRDGPRDGFRVGPNVDAPSGELGSEPGVLALLAYGQ